MGSDLRQSNVCQAALKEWAAAERALSQGRQILLLRKGGIHEEGKDFRAIYPEFHIYPKFEHQREELLQPEYRGCTSWVEVLTPVSLGRLQPVLGDEEFRQRVDQVKTSIGMAAIAC
mgnify:CR=1 FL=1